MSWALGRALLEAGLGVSRIRVSGVDGMGVRRLWCMGQKVVLCRLGVHRVRVTQRRHLGHSL